MTAPTLRDFTGGHHESRTGAKDCVGVGGIALYGRDLSRSDICTGWLASKQGRRFADDDESVFHAGGFLAAGRA